MCQVYIDEDSDWGSHTTEPAVIEELEATLENNVEGYKSRYSLKNEAGASASSS